MSYQPDDTPTISSTPSLTSGTPSYGATTLTTPTTTSPSEDEFAEQWNTNKLSAARASAEGVDDPFLAYEMPEVPAGYVVGTAAVLGGEKGEYGNEGEGRDSSRDKYLYEVRGLLEVLRMMNGVV